jgi:hypothetical protein
MVYIGASNPDLYGISYGTWQVGSRWASRERSQRIGGTKLSGSASRLPGNQLRGQNENQSTTFHRFFPHIFDMVDIRHIFYWNILTHCFNTYWNILKLYSWYTLIFLHVCFYNYCYIFPCQNRTFSQHVRLFSPNHSWPRCPWSW